MKVKSCSTFERLMPTTADGHIIKVTTYYSSFDKDTIDTLQKEFTKQIGSGIVSEFEFSQSDAEKEKHNED